MSYYSLSDTVNSCSDFIIDSCIGGFVRNPIIAGIIVTFITIAVINVTGNKNLKRSFVIGTAINTAFLFVHTEGLTRYLQGKDRSSKLAARFNQIQESGVEPEDEFIPEE